MIQAMSDGEILTGGLVLAADPAGMSSDSCHLFCCSTGKIHKGATCCENNMCASSHSRTTTVGITAHYYHFANVFGPVSISMSH